MNPEINFEALSKTLQVSERVLECLYQYVPFLDSFRFLTDVNPSHFWATIDDSLPTSVSLELHSIHASIPCLDKDFPTDTLEPYLQDFWAADIILHSATPEFKCPYSFPQFSSEDINKILPTLEKVGWSQNADNQWSIGGFSFSTDSLSFMCESFISGAKPYLVCENDDIRSAFIEMDKFIQKFAKPEKISTLSQCLKLFQFDVADKLSQISKTSLPSFELNSAILNGLSALMQASESYVQAEPICPKISALDEWIKTTAENLEEQMKLPFENRSGFIETPQLFKARSGLPIQHPFETSSLAEFLFSNSSGLIMPLPYISGKAEIQSCSSAPIHHQAFRKFVARQLMEQKYQTTTESCIDILADLSEIFVKRIAQDATATKKGSPKASNKDILNQILKKYKSDMF